MTDCRYGQVEWTLGRRLSLRVWDYLSLKADVMNGQGPRTPPRSRRAARATLIRASSALGLVSADQTAVYTARMLTAAGCDGS